MKLLHLSELLLGVWLGFVSQAFAVEGSQPQRDRLPPRTADELEPQLDHPLATPLELQVQASQRNVVLTWTHESSATVQFQIERAVHRSSFVPLAQLSPGITVFEDLLPSDGSYRYRVRALDPVSGSSSIYSDTVEIRIKGRK